MSRDYYEILGVPKNASDEDIKKAYRKLAREHHPDMVKDKDKTEAEKKFKELSAAYQVLSDTQKRKMYDQYGHAGVNQGGNAGGNRGPFNYSYSTGGNPFGDENIDPFDIFESFFGKGFSQRRPQKGKDLHYEMHIEFREAVFGLEKEISIDSGKVTIKIPAGIRDGSEIRFSGKGMAGPNNLPNGDLYITVRYKSPSEFEIHGANILVVKEIDFILATLGGELEIPVIDTTTKNGIDKTKLKIPAGTQYGTRFLVRSKGMPRVQASGQGDAIVQVIVVIPKSLNRKQKKVLEDYKNS
jgi:DnaJ-class molecular chaperone